MQDIPSKTETPNPAAPAFYHARLAQAVAGPTGPTGPAEAQPLSEGNMGLPLSITWIQSATLTGDINKDGYVNVGDLQLLVAAWDSQKTPPSGNWNASADCNSDDYVNVGDLQILVANWGRSL